MRSMRCSKCQSAMAEGFVVDKTDSGYKVSFWAEGAPRRGFWGLKLKGRRRIDIETMRCTRCGFLESYAPG